MTKVLILVFGVITAGATYATYYGIGAESLDVVKSIRAGSVGNARAYGIK